MSIYTPLTGDERCIDSFAEVDYFSIFPSVSIYASMEYPIHSACIGGNLDIVKWLLEGRMCTLVDTKTGSPLRTSGGLTALDLAAHAGADKVLHSKVIENLYVSLHHV